MAYQTKIDVNGSSADSAIQLGGTDKKTGKPNPSEIEGYFLGSKAVKTTYGDSKLHIFQTAKGKVGVWSRTRLDKLLTSDLVGQMVKAVFTGMSKPTRPGVRASYEFTVMHDAQNTLDISTVEAAQAEAEYSEEESEEEYEEAPAPVAVAPKVAASVPSADRKAQLQSLLNRRSA